MIVLPKVVLSYLDSVTSVDTVRSFSRKLAPPLVTLLNSEPETQYVALRNINLIVQKRPGILESEIKVRCTRTKDRNERVGGEGVIVTGDEEGSATAGRADVPVVVVHSPDPTMLCREDPLGVCRPPPFLMPHSPAAWGEGIGTSSGSGDCCTEGGVVVTVLTVAAHGPPGGTTGETSTVGRPSSVYLRVPIAHPLWLVS